MKKAVRGFTLVELLVVIAIIAILAAVVIFIINPIEIINRTKDANRMSDLDSLQKAIATALADASTPTTILCYSLTPPCTGLSTDADARKNDGTGWVKTNFAGQATITYTTLPQDPANNSTNHYTYSSDGTNFELNAVFESNQYKDKMSTDGGDNNDTYEIGSSLTLLN